MKTKFSRTWAQTVLLDLLIQEVKASKTFSMCQWSYGAPGGEQNISPKHTCGTAACIGGHLASILERLHVPAKTGGYVRNTQGELIVAKPRQLATFIGVDKATTDTPYYYPYRAMFMPQLHLHGVAFRAKKDQKGYISKKRAIVMLERFRDTNVVNWSFK